MPKNDRARPARRNPLTTHRVTEIDWKDTDLLRRFISDRGKIRARRVTALTPQEQNQVAVAIKNAREMALLPYPAAPRTNSAHEQKGRR